MQITCKCDIKDRWPGVGAPRPIWWPVMEAAGQGVPGGGFGGARVTGWLMLQERHPVPREEEGGSQGADRF